jgi:hypothetical protein
VAHPWIVVRDADGRAITEPGTGMPLPVAAIIIAPGAALEGQDRSGAAPAPQDYLDSITIGATTYDNSDADGCPDAVMPPCEFPSAGEEFIVHPAAGSVATFNDRLVYITVDELMRTVEKRVLGEVAIALNRYRSAHGAYPWLASFTDPESASFKSGLFRDGLLAMHLPDEIFSTSLGGSWNFIDATPTTVIWHSGDAALTPPLADLRAGKIQVTSSNGRCRWTDRTRADCMGSRIIPEYFRADLGISVTRTVEYFFSVVDKTPEVMPPTSADSRRRALSISGSLLPEARSLSHDHPPLWSEVPWSIRITDDDGVNRGRRDIRIDSDTAGAITLTGIRFDMSIVYDDIDDVRDELPEWFVENNWHHFIYAAFSGDAVAGGGGECSTPVNRCLTLTVDGTVVRNDVRALLVSAGSAWPHQDRITGDCDSDGVGDDFLCAYFDGDNGDKSTVSQHDVYARDRYSVGFNDQVRIVEPLPP